MVVAIAIIAIAIIAIAAACMSGDRAERAQAREQRPAWELMVEGLLPLYEEMIGAYRGVGGQYRSLSSTSEETVGKLVESIGALVYSKSGGVTFEYIEDKIRHLQIYTVAEDITDAGLVHRLKMWDNSLQRLLDQTIEVHRVYREWNRSQTYDPF